MTRKLNRLVDAIADGLRASGLQPHPSSFHFFARGICHFALADYDRAIAAFLQYREQPILMPNHYELAVTYGVRRARRRGAGRRMSPLLALSGH